MNKQPIGIFDSGLGGLTVYKEVKRILPYENTIYLGDTARVPYGNRSKETVIKFALDDVDFLLSQNVKSIVVACNTVSSQAIDDIKRKVDIPIVDVVSSGSKAAYKNTSNGRIGVLATRGTVGSRSYTKKLLNYDKNIKVFEKAAPLLVPFIEEGELSSIALELVLKNYLDPLLKKKIDVLVLGCTHYPIIKKKIIEVVGSDIKLIDSGEEIALNLQAKLSELDLFNSNEVVGTNKFFITDKSENFVDIAENYLGETISDKLVIASFTN